MKGVLNNPQSVVIRYPVLVFFISFFSWIYLSFLAGGLFARLSGYVWSIANLKLHFIFEQYFKNDIGRLAFQIVKSTGDGVLMIVNFVPIVFCIFFFINFATNSGFVSLISSKLNGFLVKYLKINADVFIPLITGVGCTVPAYMAVGVIKDKKQRFLANLMVSFIPCSAKNTVFVLFCINLFGSFYGSIALFVIYIFSFVFGLLIVFILSFFDKKTLKQTKFIISNTQNSINISSLIVKKSYSSAINKVVDYLKGIASTIFMFSLLFSLLNCFGFNFTDGFYFCFNALADVQKPSLIMQISLFATKYIFSILDLPWQIVFAIISGFVAKEVSITALGVVFAGTVNQNIASVIVNKFSIRIIIEFMCFMFFYMPCVSATITLIKQSKNAKEPLFIFIITTFFAYLSCFTVKILMS
jgi:ferrous iron transport protein B